MLLPFAMQGQNLSEGFESTTFPPDGWATVHVSGSSSWQRSTGYSHSGSACARRGDVSGGYNDWLISPQLAPETGDSLAFFLASEYASEYAGTTLTVEVSTTTTATSAFTVVATWTSGPSGTFGTEADDDWVRKAVDLSAYDGQYIYVAIHAVDVGYNADVLIDDITGPEVVVPTCLPVQNLAITGTTDESLTLSWSDNRNSSASYTIYDVDNDIVLQSGVSDLTYTVYGLDANTQYTLAVAADCGGGDLSAAVNISGRTACGAIATLPYSTSFEAADLQGTSNATAIPQCWMRYNTASSGSYANYPYSYNYTSDARTGSNSMYFYSYNNNYADTTGLILPPLDIDVYTMGNNRVTFWARSSVNQGHTILVGTLDNPSDIGTFSVLDTVTVIGDTYTKYTASLTGADPSNAYVALIVPRVNGTMYIDDLTLEEQPSCPDITGLRMADVSSNSVTLSWNPANGAMDYTVYDMADNSIVGTIYDTAYTIGQLDANTAYTFGVQSNCNNGDGTVSTIDVRTACATIDSLPYSTSFEADELQGTTSAEAMPMCWTRYNTLPAGSSYNYYPYSYNYSSYSRTGSRSMYFTASTYGTYADTTGFILPGVDVTTYPMSGNRLKFWARMSYSGSYTLIVGVMGNPADIGTFTATDTVRVSGSTYTEYTASLSGAPATSAFVAVMVPKVTSTMYLDDLTLEELPPCPDITGLAVDSTTSSSISLSWDTVDAAEGYTIYNMADTSVVGTSTDPAFTVDNLAANTAYTFGVRSNCSGGDGVTATVSGTTACGDMAMPWSENFDGWTSKSPCWSFLSGAFNGGNGTTTISNSAWTLGSSYGSYITLSGNALTMNLYSTYHYWMVTPPTVIEGDAMLTFDMAVSAYSSSIPDFDSDDTLAIAVSANGGTSYTPLRVLGNTELNAMANSYTTVMVPVVGYDGQTVRFAIYGGSNGGNGDNRIVIDNVSVTEAPDCMPVANPMATAIGTEEATLTWVGNATAYNVYAISDTDTTMVGSVSDTAIELTGLTAMTTYTYAVAADCDGSESEWRTVSFRTACSVVTLPYTEDFENGIDCWTKVDCATSTGVSTAAAYSGNSSLRFSYNTNPPQYVISPELDADGNGIHLSFMYRAYMSDYPESFAVGYSTTTNAIAAFTWLDEVTNITNTTYTAHNEYLPAGVKYVAVKYTANDQYYLYIDSMVFSPIDDDFCFPVTDLAVAETDAESVTLSWSGSAVSYSIYNGSTFVGTTTDTSYTVTDLDASTTYTFGVVAVCTDDSADIRTVEATTECTGGNCTIAIYASDGYGDGWLDDDGYYYSSLNIVQNGITVATYSMQTQNQRQTTIYDTFRVSVCSSYPVAFSWTSNSEYDDEAAFEITDGSGTVIYTVTDASTLGSSTFFTLNSPCPTCVAPTVTLDSVSTNSVSISWTSDAASFNVYNGSTLVQSGVTGTSYTFGNLDASTTYTFGVQAVCDANDSSEVMTLTVMTNCTDITALPYSEDFEGGNLGCWSTVNGSSDGRAWSIYNTANNNNFSAHSGSNVASSWSWSSNAMHADAWLVSPRFVLPTVGTGDSIVFSWWHIVHGQYPDSYSVVISTTDDDTASFTIVARPLSPGEDSVWTMKSIDLTDYAGQGIYIAFHHVDYDNNYLFIDDISLSVSNATPQVGIEDAGLTDVDIYSANSAIYVRGAEGKSVYVYDLNGRVLHYEANATKNGVFRMEQTGVYLVKVGDAAARRIVVVR